MSIRSSVLLAVLIVLLCLFGLREFRNEQAKAAVFPVVRALGGRIASIPVEPLGTEYLISFQCDLTADELRQLVILNRLVGRNTVSVTFVDSNVTAEDVAALKRKMPDVAVFRVVDGESFFP